MIILIATNPIFLVIISKFIIFLSYLLYDIKINEKFYE